MTTTHLSTRVWPAFPNGTDPLLPQYLAYQALLLDYFWFPSPESARLVSEFQFSIPPEEAYEDC